MANSEPDLEVAVKLLDLTIPYEPLEKKALYSEITKEYRWLANGSSKMRLLVATEPSEKTLPKDFAQKLVENVPALNYQLCTNHGKQSFAEHLGEEQNDLPHVLEHIIIGLLMMIKNDNYHGITMGNDDLAEIIITYNNKKTAVELAYLGIELLKALIAGKEIDLIGKIKDINGGRVLVWRKNAKGAKIEN